MYPMQDDPYAQQQMPMQPGQQQLDPQMVQAIMQLQMQNPQQKSLQRQQRMADMLRADAGQQLQGMRTGKDGRYYTPPNLLNLGASVMAGYKARGLENDAATREQNMAAQRQDALMRYFGAATGQKRPQVPYLGAEGE